MELPAKHCAFKNCTWNGASDEELRLHLEQAHSEVLDRGAGTYPTQFSVEECRWATYMRMISLVVRKGAPPASYAIDRRSLFGYATAHTDGNIETLVCVLCGCCHPVLGGSA